MSLSSNSRLDSPLTAIGGLLNVGRTFWSKVDTSTDVPILNQNFGNGQDVFGTSSIGQVRGSVDLPSWAPAHPLSSKVLPMAF
jgi:hypothetical protein